MLRAQYLGLPKQVVAVGGRASTGPFAKFRERVRHCRHPFNSHGKMIDPQTNFQGDLLKLSKKGHKLGGYWDSLLVSTAQQQTTRAKSPNEHGKKNPRKK